MRRNPYRVALLVVGGLSFVVAMMLALVISELTDYEDYDQAAVAEIGGWTDTLVVISIASLIGAVIIAGVEWSLREARRPDALPLPDERADVRE